MASFFLAASSDPGNRVHRGPAAARLLRACAGSAGGARTFHPPVAARPQPGNLVPGPLSLPELEYRLSFLRFPAAPSWENLLVSRQFWDLSGNVRGETLHPHDPSPISQEKIVGTLFHDSKKGIKFF